MFDRLEDLLIRYEEVMGELQEPGVADDPVRFRKLMKEQSDLAPIVEAYNEYKQCRQNIEDSLAMLEEESDEEMRELAKEELSDSRKRVEELEQELKILLLPKDPNDDKNVIVEIRAGAGGDEAALFAAEIYRMYVHYADSRRWKTEMISLNENGIGGFKECVFMITGQGAYSRLKYESGVHRVQRVPETERQKNHSCRIKKKHSVCFVQNSTIWNWKNNRLQKRRLEEVRSVRETVPKRSEHIISRRDVLQITGSS